MLITFDKNETVLKRVLGIRFRNIALPGQVDGTIGDDVHTEKCVRDVMLYSVSHSQGVTIVRSHDL